VRATGGDSRVQHCLTFAITGLHWKNVTPLSLLTKAQTSFGSASPMRRRTHTTVRFSELKFFGAIISKATHEQWEDWRRAGAPKNFVTCELLALNDKTRWEHPL